MTKRLREDFEDVLLTQTNYNFVWEQNNTQHFVWSYAECELTQKRMPSILKRGINRFLESQRDRRTGRRSVLRKSQDDYVIAIDANRINIRTYCEELLMQRLCEIIIPGRNALTFKLV
jgi:hypothetical protein